MTAGTELVLGLDLGANSVGWAALREGQKSSELLGLGVRVFEAGMDGSLEQGKEESRNKGRRDARLMRRQLDRRARRDRRLARELQAAGLLPGGAIESGADRHAFFERLDKELIKGASIHATAEDLHRFHNTFPYWLRARALEIPLHPHALGRALYHLGQRRGFLSNRKSVRKDDEKSKVYSGISDLEEKIREAGCDTLGQYFSQLDPTAYPGRRIRERYTHRRMYEHEFERIWESQKPHHRDLLTDAFHKQIRRTIFYQRPLKSVKALIGCCQFERIARGAEKDRKRAPWAILPAQRFRLLQKLNDLTIVEEYVSRPLNAEQRQKLLEVLENDGDLKFTEIKSKRLLNPNKTVRLNLEAAEESKIPGNRTNAAMRKIFGARWEHFSASEKDAVVDDILSFSNPDALERRARRHYQLDAASARALADLELEPDYCNLSRKALQKILPHMERGLHYMEAARLVYPEHEMAYVLEELPPVNEGLVDEVRNPTVFRALTEMRKVVNAVIRRYGKPDKIRIELARDVKRSKKEREKIYKKNREREGARERAKGRILNEIGIQEPTRDAIERVLLADECGWECPYSGKQITMGNLLGDATRFDVEHILPFSRSLDNSFLNKTLCYHEENRSRKKNRTPWEAYHGTEQYEEVLQRVRRFQGDAKEAKLRRFLMEDAELEEQMSQFTETQLNDTRYASRLAAQFCAMLYGKEWRQHVQASKGQTTAELRKAWKLNSILGDGNLKTRDDHRHHAIDALTIALCSPKMLAAVRGMAQRAEREGHNRWWNFIELPWAGFLQDVQKHVDAIVVSHRPERKLNGPLHNETIYSLREYKDTDGKTCLHLRRSIDTLTSEKDIEKIVDSAVREAVRKQVRALGGNFKALKDPANHPVRTTANGRLIPIHRVRVREQYGTTVIAGNGRQRRIREAGNHHMVIWAVLDDNGDTKKWTAEVISRYEAFCRKSEGHEIVQRADSSCKRFVCSLSSGDSFLLNFPAGTPRLFVLRTAYMLGREKPFVEFVGASDSRLFAEIRLGKAWYKKSPDQLRRLGFQKASVTPDGQIRNAND